MADPPGQYVAYDHTDLERRRKKLWNLADGVPLTILGGIGLRALVTGGIAFLGLLGGVMLAAPVCGLALNVWTILGCLAIAVTLYVLGGDGGQRPDHRTEHPGRGRLPLPAAAPHPRARRGRGAGDRALAGLLWRPVHPRWHQALAQARAERSERLLRPCPPTRTPRTTSTTRLSTQQSQQIQQQTQSVSRGHRR